MYDRRSIYALNKKNPDAMVLPDADGNLICLTCADFTDEAEFRRWKRWSDQDFHAEDKSDVEESDHTTSMDMVPEAALAVPNEEALAEERQVREDQIRCAEAAVSGIRSILIRARGHRHRQCEQRAHHCHLRRLRPKEERIHLRQYALELSAQDGKRRVQHLPRPLGLPAGREKPCRPRGGGRDRAAYLPRIPLRQESAGDRGNPEHRGYIGTDMEI